MRLTLFLALAAFASIANAGPIPIINSSFEDPDIGGGSSTWGSITVPGWMDGPASPIGATILHPSASAVIQPHDGAQMVTFQVANAYGNIYIQQNTAATFEANTTYTASVFLAATSSSGQTTGTIELVANDVVVASSQAILDAYDGSSPRWTEHTVSLTTGIADAFLGDTLGIRLYRTPGHFSAHFDSVGLNAVSTNVPGPAGLGLVLIGCAGLLLGRMKRR